jgi:hypothetical protein
MKSFVDSFKMIFVILFEISEESLKASAKILKEERMEGEEE